MNPSPLLLPPRSVGAVNVTSVHLSSYFWQLGCQYKKVLFTFISTFVSYFLFVNCLVTDIFGENLFEKEEIMPVFLGLIGVNKKKKAFDCVGTFEEAVDALRMTIKRFQEICVTEESSERLESSAENDPLALNIIPVVLLRLEPLLTCIEEVLN